MKINFNLVENKDRNTVLALFKETAEKISKKNIDHWQYWKNPPLEKIKWVEEGINNNEFFFIETANMTSLGMVRILNEDLLYWGKQEQKAIYIHSLVVKEKYNGKGYGIQILQTIENNAKKDNFKFLRLDSDSQNPKLCKYYEKMGFKKVGIKKMPLSLYNLYEKGLK